MLQGVEGRRACFLQGDELANEHGFVGQCPVRPDHGMISPVEVAVISGSEVHLAGCFDGQSPVAVGAVVARKTLP